MASNPETSTFDAGVYQLETTDPVTGGLGGVDNAPHVNLGNRTRWLKDNTLLKTADDTSTGKITANGGFQTVVNKGYSYLTTNFAVGSDFAYTYGMTLTQGVFASIGNYISGGGGIGFGVGGALQWTLSTSALAPISDNTKDLGTSALGIRDIYSSGKLYFAATDYLDYNRGTNVFDWRIGGVSRMTFNGATITVLTGTGQGAPAAPGLSEGLRLMNNPTAASSICATLVAGTAGVAAVCFGDKDVANQGIVKYDNATNVLELWADGDGTGASGNKLVIGGGGVSRTTHPSTTDDSLQVATTHMVQQLANLLMPAGAVLPFAMATPPSGWLQCDGTAVSRTTYARLFAAIGIVFGPGNGTTTFNLPDLRGEFVRGHDDGRGVDPARAFGSAQGAAFASHQHVIPEVADSSAINRYLYGSSNLGATDIASLDNKNANTNIAPLTSSAGGTETRPRNIALTYCIKT